MSNKKEKKYIAETNIKWSQVTLGTSKKDVLERVKETFKQEFGFEPEDDEITITEDK